MTLAALFVTTATATSVTVSTTTTPIYAEQADTAGFNKFRFGGSADVLATFSNYKYTSDQHKTFCGEISPALSLAFDYKLSPKWIVGTEIEFVAGGDIETSEGTEKYDADCYVSIKHLHITRLIIPQFNIRAGRLAVPVGLSNAHNDPMDFLRPHCRMPKQPFCQKNGMKPV